MPSRKSKQAGGNLPLTHYERTTKFSAAASGYGTTRRRLGGESLYKLGDCGLSLSRLAGPTALCSPAGYLYEPAAAVEYLLVQTAELKQRRAAYEARQEELKRRDAAEPAGVEDRKRKDFLESQRTLKRPRSSEAGGGETTAAGDSKQEAYARLKAASYWLSDAQPKLDPRQAGEVEEPPVRPVSPNSGEPLARKDLWELQLERVDGKLVCAVSGKPLRVGGDDSSGTGVIGYWTSRDKPGRIVSAESFALLEGRCPDTNARIKRTRHLQASGTGFSASGGQAKEAALYRPTMT